MRSWLPLCSLSHLSHFTRPPSSPTSVDPLYQAWQTYLAQGRDTCPQILHPPWFTTKFILVEWSCSVVSDPLWPHGLSPTRLLHPWDFPGKSTGVGCHFLLQEIFPTQGLNPALPHCRQMLYHLSHQGSHSDRCFIFIVGFIGKPPNRIGLD